VDRLTATQAARQFSEILSRVVGGEAFEVTRNGAPVAEIRPVRDQVISADRYRELIVSAPEPDDGFYEDLRAIRASVGPPTHRWPS
jgi:prevent-host-death family protein